jgi:hypothetical protein
MLRKLAVLAVFLSVTHTLVPIPRQTANSTAQTSADVKSKGKPQQNSAAVPALSTDTKQAPSANSNAAKQGGYDAVHSIEVTKFPPVSMTRDWRDTGVWVFSGLLVIVGLLQVGTMIWQARLLGGTLSEIHTQAVHMGEQVDVMKIQTGILAESVAVAEKTAKAANDNIELLIQKERAKLRIKFDPLNMNSGILSSPVTWTVFHYGTTEAFITRTGAIMAVIGDAEPPETQSGYMAGMMNFPEVIIPNSPPLQGSGFMLHTFSEAERRLVEEGKAFVYFRGLIEYKDRFDREHAIRFHKKWNVTNLNNLGKSGKFAYWINCGPESDNTET